MNNRIILFLLIPMLLFFNGCHKKQVQEKPEGLIDRNTMVEIIAESYIIESIVAYNPADSVNRFKTTKEYYKDLFDRHHVTREQFNKSVEYYMGDEDDADKILSEASQIIIKKRKKLKLNDTIVADPSANILTNPPQAYQTQTNTPNTDNNNKQ